MSAGLEAVDAYIAAAPAHAQARLQRVRDIVRAAAPGAEEMISYGIPAVRGRGVFIYFGAFKTHIGMFPPIHGDEAPEQALTRYRGPKGNLRSPLSEPLPEALIERVVRLAVERDGARTRRRKPRPRPAPR